VARPNAKSWASRRPDYSARPGQRARAQTQIKCAWIRPELIWADHSFFFSAARFLSPSLRFFMGFWHKILDLRRSNRPIFDSSSETWSLHLDLRFHQSFWGKTLNSCSWDLWVKILKCEFNSHCSLGVWVVGDYLRLPKLWVVVWWILGNFFLKP
jgi:hypothetical protein